MTSLLSVVEREKMQADNSNKNAFCRLCFSVINYSDVSNCSEVSAEVAKKFFEVVLPNIVRRFVYCFLLRYTLDTFQDLEGIHKHQICKACNSKLIAAFNFKTNCMHTEDIILPHVNVGNVSAIELKEVYLKVNENISLTDIWENQKICRLCLRLITYGFVSLIEVDRTIIDTYIPLVVSMF